MPETLKMKTDVVFSPVLCVRKLRKRYEGRKVSNVVYYLSRFGCPFVGRNELALAGLYVVFGRGHLVLDAIYQFALLALRSVALGGNGTHDQTFAYGRLVHTRYTTQ